MANEYKVLTIDELTRVGETGAPEHYYRHTIRTKGGVRLSVEIGEKDFTEEKAGPILLAKAQNADKILKM